MAGYGFIIKMDETVKEYNGGAKNTTNNIMEMTAALKALEILDEPCEVELTTDSQYLVKGITEWIQGWIRKGWQTASRQPVKNKELWQKLNTQNKKHKVTWVWVRGHNGHPENERCDALANEGIASSW